MATSRLQFNLRLMAVLSLALFINATAIAPAFHEHRGMHDPHRCLLCSLELSGVWAPAPEMVMPTVGLFSLDAPAALQLYFPTTVVSAPLARGPPA